MANKLNPLRLELARTRRQLSLKDLAEKVGLSARMVAEYEKDYCRHFPPDETIKAFSDALNYPVEFLLSEEAIETINKDTVSFRSLKSMRASQERAAVAAGSLGVMINDYFENHFKLKTSDLPDYRNIEPEAAAEALRQYWDIGNASIGNMIHLLEKHGVRVFSLTEANQEVDAFSFWKGGTPFVFLNTFKSSERSRFDAAHELGHLLLHRNKTVQDKNAENEADRFASAFLMPKVTLLEYKGKHLGIESILKLKLKWKVSAMALIVQMKNTGVISEWQYKTLIIAASKMGLRTSEINGIEKESSLVIQKILDILEADGVTLSKLAFNLDLPIDEVSSLLFKFHVVSNEQSSFKNATDSPRPVLRLVE